MQLPITYQVTLDDDGEVAHEGVANLLLPATENRQR
jgi:hypothetical protein